MLIKVAFAPLAVAVGEMREGICGCERIDFILGMVVERDVQERVVVKPQDQVNEIVRTGLRKLSEHPLDPALILVCCLGRDGGISGDHAKLRWYRC